MSECLSENGSLLLQVDLVLSAAVEQLRRLAGSSYDFVVQCRMSTTERQTSTVLQSACCFELSAVLRSD